MSTSPLLEQPADAESGESPTTAAAALSGDHSALLGDADATQSGGDGGDGSAGDGDGQDGGAGGGRNTMVFVHATVHSLGAFLYGYDTAIVSPTVSLVQEEFDIGELLTGAWVSALIAGALIGALAAGPAANRLGRLRTLLVADVPLVLGAIGCAMSVHIAMLIAMRVLLGIGIGLTSMVVPLLLTELAPARVRGAVGTLNQLFITVGIAVAYSVGYAFDGRHVLYDWRYQLGLGAVPALLHAVLALTVSRVESPRWLLGRGRDADARRVVRRLGLGDAHVAALRRDMRAAGGGGAQDATGAAQRRGFDWWALGIGLFVQLAQQWSGINAVIFYSKSFFQQAGLTGPGEADLASIGLGVLNVAVTVGSVFLIERAGRRVLLWGGLLPMIVALCSIGASTFLFQAMRIERAAHAAISVTSVLTYVVGFAVGLGPIPWLIMAEMFPQSTRATAMSCATALNWTANGVLALLFPVLVGPENENAAYVFWAFAGMCMLALIGVMLFVPETRNKSVEQVQRELRRPSNMCR